MDWGDHWPALQLLSLSRSKVDAQHMDALLARCSGGRVAHPRRSIAAGYAAAAVVPQTLQLEMGTSCQAQLITSTEPICNRIPAGMWPTRNGRCSRFCGF